MRLRPRFSLKLLGILTAVFAGVFAILSYRLRQNQELQRIAAEFRQQGVYVQFNSRGELNSASFAPSRSAGQPLPPVRNRPTAQVSAVVHIPTLENVSFCGAMCTDGDVASVASKPLKWIDLSDTQVTDAGLAHLSDMTSLTELYINNTAVSDDGVASLSKLYRLKTLSLIQTRITDKSISFLHELTDLESLDLRGNAMTDHTLLMLKPLKNLRFLFLNGERMDITGRYLDLVQLSEDGVSAIAELEKLENLELSNCGLTDHALRYIAKLQSLESLVLSRNNEITDAGLQHLKSLQKLRQLFITSTSITHTGISDLQTALPQCQISWQY